MHRKRTEKLCIACHAHGDVESSIQGFSNYVI